eukprot:s5019_g2.t1
MALQRYGATPLFVRAFDFTGDYCITGSIDRSCKLWDVNNGQCMETLRGHSDEVLDVCFNTTGNRLVTASADCTARVYNVMTGACISILIGHEGEISKAGYGSKLWYHFNGHF